MRQRGRPFYRMMDGGGDRLLKVQSELSDFFDGEVVSPGDEDAVKTTKKYSMPHYSGTDGYYLPCHDEGEGGGRDVRVTALKRPARYNKNCTAGLATIELKPPHVKKKNMLAVCMICHIKNFHLCYKRGVLS